MDGPVLSPSAATELPETYIHPSVSIQAHPTAPRKGVCTIATKPITQGTLLFRERPLIILEGGNVSVTALRKAWNGLTDDQKDELWGLASAHGIDIGRSRLKQSIDNWQELSDKELYLQELSRQTTDKDVVEFDLPPPAEKRPFAPIITSSKHIPQGIWDRNVKYARMAPYKTVLSTFVTNAITIPVWDEDDDEEESWGSGGAATFQNISRINHSCVPNASFTWRTFDPSSSSQNGSTPSETLSASVSTAMDDHDEPPQGVEEVWAIRDIAAGEEVTIAYIDSWRMNEVRAGALRHYGFECDCPACDPSNLGFGPNFYDESRERRFTLEDIEEQIPPDGRFWPAEDGHLNERLKLALQTAAILRQEWAYTGKLGRIYHDIALLAWNQGEGGLAETAARSAIYVYATSCGLDHQYTRFERGRFRDMIQKIKLENAKKDGEATHNGGEVVEYAETDAAVEQVTKLGI